MDHMASEAEAIKNLKSSHNRKKLKSGGGFQVMGLSRPVLNGILRKGYKIPTPIQRKTIPLILEGKDVVAMARTGSGKTAAFLVPLFERLQVHSAKVGARALILAPTRELALQTLGFAKELGRFTNIKAAVILGGDGFNEQFTALHKNPDVIIATPGRFVHICVEMDLKLDSIEYVVFDEADRLFEMGFYEQLNEIINRLPENRQTLLFSATLPKLLVEFAQAGLTDPVLIRLDVESKIPKTLKQTYFQVKSEEKLPALLHLLINVIPKREQTLIFVATKTHVEYLHQLLNALNIPSTYIYSSLDSAARKINVAKFRSKKVNLLIVTDIAARGIDIPLLSNVINYNFPCKEKLFVHRVGRVARAGKTGTSYSLISPDEFPYLLDLHIFLNIELKYASTNNDNSNEDWHQVYGKVPQNIVDDYCDFILKKHSLIPDLNDLSKSVEKAQAKYIKTRSSASKGSIRRAKAIVLEKEIGFHPMLSKGSEADIEKERISLLDKLKEVRPKCTIFEIKRPGIKHGIQTPAFMADIRAHDEGKIQKFHKSLEEKKLAIQKKENNDKSSADSNQDAEDPLSFPQRDSSAGTGSKVDDYFLPYKASDALEEQGYAVTSFERESSKATLDMLGDDEDTFKRPQSLWDRKKKKFVTQVQKKKIKTESGVWISASYKSDIYEKWKQRMNQQDDDVKTAFDEDEDITEARPVHPSKKKKAEGFVTLNVHEDKGQHPLLHGKPQVKGPRAGILPLEKRQKILRRKRRIQKQEKQRQIRNKERRMKRNKWRSSRLKIPTTNKA